VLAIEGAKMAPQYEGLRSVVALWTVHVPVEVMLMQNCFKFLQEK
jgi:hypothetical protein